MDLRNKLLGEVSLRSLLVRSKLPRVAVAREVKDKLGLEERLKEDRLRRARTSRK